jgi:two-component system nitrate/nitrite response regulator NarL
MAYRVVVVDDHPVVVEGVRQILTSEPDVEVVGRAYDGASGIRLVGEMRPDAVILDLRLGDGSGPDLCRDMLRAVPDMRVLLHTAFDNQEPLRACLRWGAAGVVFKDGMQLVPALRAVLAGETYLDPRMNSAPQNRASANGGDFVVEQLSPREYEVLCAFALGHSTRQVAGNLHLTENTVRSYTKSLLAKLRASSRIQALATARQLRLLP